MRQCGQRAQVRDLGAGRPHLGELRELFHERKVGDGGIIDAQAGHLREVLRGRLRHTQVPGDGRPDEGFARHAVSRRLLDDARPVARDGKIYERSLWESW